MVESTSQKTRAAARTPGEDDVQPRLRLRFALYTGLVLLGTGLAITWLVNREVENRAARTVESQARAVAVTNLLGSLFIGPPVSPFEVIDDLVEEARARTPVIFVDMHAEATSEKVAMARWLDGKVTAVIGTHTHVQTNDARVQPGGTAAITDAGMIGLWTKADSVTVFDDLKYGEAN